MSERLTTAGKYLAYAVETTPGTMPTSGYKKIPEIKSMPSINPAPSTVTTTTFEDVEYETYAPGLKSLGGPLDYTANCTQDLMDFWDTLLTEYESAAAENKAMWFVVGHPKLTKATYYKGDPSALGENASEVGGANETTLYITPTNAPKREKAPTFD
jgi:hypothetical protein